MAVPITLEELNAQLWELFPARGETSSIELADTAAVCRVPARPKDVEDTLHIVVRLVIWDQNEETGQLSIRDVKEQQIYIGPVSILERGERLLAFFRASFAALQKIFESDFESTHQIETLMPHDLWRPEILKLVKAQTEDDFLRALLTKSRLGRFLPSA